MKTKFIGNAYQLVNSTSPNTYEDLKKLLISTYVPKKSRAELNTLFYNCVQGLDEPTCDYFRRLKGHLHEIREILTAKFEGNEALTAMHESEAIDIFKRGSNNTGLKKHLIMDESQTLAELKIVVNKYENSERQSATGMIISVIMKTRIPRAE